MSLPNVRNTNGRLAAGTGSALGDSVTTARPSGGGWLESQRWIPHQAPRITNANAFLQKLWVPRLSNGMDEETERGRQHAIHARVTEAVKLPGILLGPDGNFSTARGSQDLKASLDINRCTNLSLDFIWTRGPENMLTPGSASTIHIQVMHANQLDLDGAYEAAYSALLPGGWLVHIEAHPESEVTKRGSMHVIHTDSRAQQLVDLVPEKLQRTGFTSLSLCTGRTMIQKSAVDGVEAQAFNSELWEMRVWMAQKARISA